MFFKSRDELRRRPDVVIVPFRAEWGPIGPAGAVEYEIVIPPGDYRPHLRARMTEASEWVDVVSYDNCHGSWRPIGKQANWDIKGLTEIAKFLKGEVVLPEIIAKI